MQEEHLDSVRPLISIIVPVYNTLGRLVEDCIDSIINQTYSKLEIIIVDDGSEEQTADFLDRIGKRDKRIRVIHKEHEGVSCARNAGIANMLGDYVMFMDADDYLYTKNVLSEAIDLFKKENIPDVIIGLVIKGSEHFNFDGIYNSENENIHVKELNMEEDHYKLVSQILSNDNYYYKSYRGHINSGLVAKLIRTEVARQIRFDNRLPIGEDVVWLLQLISKLVTVSYIDSTWYYYYKNAESATSRYRKNQKEELKLELSAYQEMLSLFPENDNDFLMRYWTELKIFYRNYLFHKENNASFAEKYRDFRNIFMLKELKTMTKEVNFLYHRKTVKNVIKQIAVRSAGINMKLSFILNYILFQFKLHV